MVIPISDRFPFNVGDTVIITEDIITDGFFIKSGHKFLITHKNESHYYLNESFILYDKENPKLIYNNNINFVLRKIIFFIIWTYIKIYK